LDVGSEDTRTSLLSTPGLNTARDFCAITLALRGAASSEKDGAEMAAFGGPALL
jgi:hypothetical protein